MSQRSSQNAGIPVHVYLKMTSRTQFPTATNRAMAKRKARCLLGSSLARFDEEGHRITA